ncbi:MAG: PAS domain S-box protein [Planctomycetaceae bacterium]
MKPAEQPNLKRYAWATVLLLAANVVLGVATIHQVRNSERDAAQVQQIQTTVALLLSMIVDAETGQRGYLISGEEEYLEPYRESITAIERLLSTLDEFGEDDALLAGRMPEIRRHVAARMKELARSVDARKESGFETARAIMLSDRGKQEMERLRVIFEDLNLHNARNHASQQRRSTFTYWLSVFIAVLLGVAVIAVLVMYSKVVERHSEKQQRATDAIAAHRERLRTTLSSIGDAVISTDADGRVVDMNAVAEALTGWKTSDAVQRPLSDVFQIIGEATRKPSPSPAAAVLRGSRITGDRGSTLLIAKDGTERLIEDNAAPILNEKSQVTGCVLVFRDVTSRRQQEMRLAQNEQTFRETFDRAPTGIAHVMLDGRWLRVNEKLCEITGYSRDELLSRTALEITHPEDVTLATELVKQLLAGDIPSFALEKRYLSKNGDPVWVNLTVALMRDNVGKPDFYVVMIEDIREWRQAEENRMRLAAIVESSNDAIIGKSFEGIVTSWNPAAERLFGFTEAEILNQPVYRIVPESLHEEERQLLERISNGETVDRYESARLRKDGTSIDVVLNISPILNAKKEKIGIASIVRDITEQKKSARIIQESEERFQTLADNISQFAWMADANGWIYWYNRRWYEYTGTTFEEMQGWGWKKVHHPDHLDRVVERIQHSWDTGIPWEDTFPLRGKDGRYRWFLSRALPIRDGQGNIVNWFGSNTDITELKEYEESLQQARKAAETASHARGEFLANMSHEIRTPMTAILGHADILASHVQNPDNLACIDTIRRNGKFLLQIINDILDLSRIDAGRFHVERNKVQPDSLLADIQSLMDVRAEEKQLALAVRIDGRIPAAIESDAIRLRQILLNLVGNAIKFTDEGRVELIARFDPERKAMLFVVSDTGIGISQSDQHQLFEPFMQVDTSSTRAYEGTGLGLAICRRLAHALNGEILVSSVPGQGSTFTLVLDCGDIEDLQLVEASVFQNLRRPEQEAVSLHGSILVVDDRRDIRFLAQHMIEKAGGRVLTATNGQEAIDRLTGSQAPHGIDLVLMDMQMPVVDGYTAARTLRERGCRIPIIALTANAMMDDRNKCLQSGCTDYTTKPLDGPLLLRMISKYLPPTDHVLLKAE